MKGFIHKRYRHCFVFHISSYLIFICHFCYLSFSCAFAILLFSTLRFFPPIVYMCLFAVVSHSFVNYQAKMQHMAATDSSTEKKQRKRERSKQIWHSVIFSIIIRVFNHDYWTQTLIHLADMTNRAVDMVSPHHIGYKLLIFTTFYYNFIIVCGWAKSCAKNCNSLYTRDCGVAVTILLLFNLCSNLSSHKLYFLWMVSVASMRSKKIGLENMRSKTSNNFTKAKRTQFLYLIRWGLPTHLQKSALHF